MFLMPGSRAGIAGRAQRSASIMVTPANPSAGSTSLAGVMMGLGTSCKLSTLFYSRIRVTFAVAGANSQALGGVTTNIYYGTGTPPINGAALTGTAVGFRLFSESVAAGASQTITMYGLIRNASARVTYWFDLALGNGGAGTGTISNINFTAEEY